MKKLWTLLIGGSLFVATAGLLTTQILILVTKLYLLKKMGEPLNGVENEIWTT